MPRLSHATTARAAGTAAAAAAAAAAAGSGGGGGRLAIAGRGLHSSTFQLNLSALDGIEGARRGYVARIEGF